MSEPARYTDPVMRASSPLSALIRVDLPAPFGPMTRTTSPGAAWTDTPRITGTAPYPAVTS